MPRYLIETDEPIIVRLIEMDEPETCNRCPLFVDYYDGEYCKICVRNDNIWQRRIETGDGTETPRPDWCPLRRLD